MVLYLKVCQCWREESPGFQARQRSSSSAHEAWFTDCSIQSDWQSIEAHSRRVVSINFGTKNIDWHKRYWEIDWLVNFQMVSWLHIQVSATKIQMLTTKLCVMTDNLNPQMHYVCGGFLVLKITFRSGKTLCCTLNIREFNLKKSQQLNHKMQTTFAKNNRFNLEPLAFWTHR